MFLKRLFSKRYAAYKKYDQQAVIFQEIAKRLMDRLSIIKIEPAKILELGTNMGYTTSLLTKHYPKALVTVIDNDEHALKYARQKKRLNKAVKQIEFEINNAIMPLAEQSVDVLIANLLPLWCDSLPKLFAEVKRVLKPGGLFFFSSFGPDTLKELPDYLAQPNNLIQDKLIDMHNIGDELMQFGFAEPVMEMEMLQLSYSTVDKLVNELHTLKLIDAYQEIAKNRNNALLSFEVIYGHAWRAKMQQSAKSSEVYISTDKIIRRTTN